MDSAPGDRARPASPSMGSERGGTAVLISLGASGLHPFLCPCCSPQDCCQELWCLAKPLPGLKPPLRSQHSPHALGLGPKWDPPPPNGDNCLSAWPVPATRGPALPELCLGKNHDSLAGAQGSAGCFILCWAAGRCVHGVRVRSPGGTLRALGGAGRALLIYRETGRWISAWSGYAGPRASLCI